MPAPPSTPLRPPWTTHPPAPERHHHPRQGQPRRGFARSHRAAQAQQDKPNGHVEQRQPVAVDVRQAHLNVFSQPVPRNPGFFVRVEIPQVDEQEPVGHEQAHGDQAHANVAAAAFHDVILGVLIGCCAGLPWSSVGAGLAGARSTSSARGRAGLEVVDEDLKIGFVIETHGAGAARQ